MHRKFLIEENDSPDKKNRFEYMVDGVQEGIAPAMRFFIWGLVFVILLTWFLFC
jgi:hypothetical protein